MAKASKRIKIMLLSTGEDQKGKPTKTFYTTYKNTQNTTDKIVIRKFDPKAWNTEKNCLGAYVDFKEKKIPK